MLENKINELTQKIESCENEYDNFLKNAKVLKEQIIEAIINELKIFCKMQIGNKVKTEVEVTNSLGIENLKKLKKSMNEIIENMDSKKTELSNNNKIWIINTEDLSNLINNKDRGYRIKPDGKQSIRDNISESMVRLTADIGSLLYEYKYIDFNNNKQWVRVNGKIVYSYYMGGNYEPILDEKKREYQDLFEKSYDKFKEIYDLKRKLEETKALYLWEQA